MLLNRPVNLPQNEILTAGESGDYTDMHRHGAALAELEQSPEQQLLAVQAVRKIPEQAAAVGTALPALVAESVLLPAVLHLELFPERMLLILSRHANHASVENRFIHQKMHPTGLLDGIGQITLHFQF